MQKNQGKPLLHFDLHGSLNRDYTADVEVGVDSVESLWPYKDQASISGPFIKALKSAMNTVFQDIKLIDGQSVKWDDKGYLRGFWGDPWQTYQTMSTQGAIHGIPSF